MIELVSVVGVEALDGQRLNIVFSNGSSGIKDLSDLLTLDGPMVKPLRDPAMFRRVFLHCGVPTWPNGFDLDAVRLHDEMASAGLLTQARMSPRDAAE